MAKSTKIPKPSGVSGVTKVRHPKPSKPTVDGGSIADVCKPRNASADPEVFFGELVEETIPEVDSETSEPTTNAAATETSEAVVEEQIEETVMEEIPVLEPEVEVEVFEPLPVVTHKKVQPSTPPVKPVPRARIVVKCALYTYRGRKVTQGQSFVVEGDDIFKYGNPDMFDIFYL